MSKTSPRQESRAISFRLSSIAVIALAAALGGLTAVASPSTVITLLHSFSGSDGSVANAVTLDGGGNLFGTTEGGGAGEFGTIFKVTTGGAGFQILRSFSGTNGSVPLAGLVLDSNNYLYGTTSGGGANEDSCTTDGCGGTIFKVKSDGTGFAVLRSFSSSDGAFPATSLFLDSGGYLYGTTVYGGTGTNCGDPPCGNVFKVRTDGTGFTVLHSFGSSATDGNDPWSNLILDAGGYLYGTTTGADAAGNCSQMGELSGCGNVFKVKTDGTGFMVLHSFSGPDGGAPYTGLALDGNGFLYGTTTVGGTGTACGGSPCGNIFRIKTDGSGFTVLHNFTGADGSSPLTTLILDSSGNLYGTANIGGTVDSNSSYCQQGCGTVFTIMTDGTGFGLLHSFTTAANDGQNPQGLIFDGVRNLYGATYEGGVHAPTSNTQTGTVFKLPLAIVAPVRASTSPIAIGSPSRTTGRKHPSG